MQESSGQEQESLEQEFIDLEFDLMEMATAVQTVDDMIEFEYGIVKLQERVTPFMKLISRRLSELSEEVDAIWRRVKEGTPAE